MKVNVTKTGHFAKIDGVMTELKAGEQELDTELAKTMIKSGYALEVEAKAEVKPEAKAKKATTKK